MRCFHNLESMFLARIQTFVCLCIYKCYSSNPPCNSLFLCWWQHYTSLIGIVFEERLNGVITMGNVMWWWWWWNLFSASHNVKSLHSCWRDLTSKGCNFSADSIRHVHLSSYPSLSFQKRGSQSRKLWPTMTTMPVKPQLLHLRPGYKPNGASWLVLTQLLPEYRSNNYTFFDDVI